MIKIFIPLLLVFNIANALLTIDQETVIINTTPFTINENLSSINFKLNKAKYGSEVTDKFEEVLLKKINNLEFNNNTKQNTMTIDLKFADESDIKYNGITRKIAEEENKTVENSNAIVKAAKGFVKGTVNGVTSIADHSAGGGPVELALAATFGIVEGVMGLIGQDNTYLVVMDIAYKNQKTRLFIQTTRMHLSIEDAIETLSTATIDNISLLLPKDKKWD